MREDICCVKTTCGKAENLFRRAVCLDTVYFAWAIFGEEYTLLDVITTWNVARGPCIYHHLISINASNEIVDRLEAFASVNPIAVENPYGGTSTGTETKEGELYATDRGEIGIKTQTDSETKYYRVTPSGHFDRSPK
jgi:hypothetical protein